MAKVYSRASDGVLTVNYTPATGGESIFNVKECLKAAGWKVVYSGDGVATFQQFADVITHAGSGANGMNNSYAWFVIQEPAYASGTAGSITVGATTTLDDASANFSTTDIGAFITIEGATNAANNGHFKILNVVSATQIEISNASAVSEAGISWRIARRNFLFQRGMNSRSYRVYYSAVDHFTGVGFGAVSATVPPSATDQQQVVGLSNGYTNLLDSDGLYRYHVVAMNAPVGGVYPFYMWSSRFGNRSPQYCFAFEAMDSGSYVANSASLDTPNGDIDPCVIIFNATNGFIGSSIENNSYGWFARNTAYSQWVNLAGHRIQDSVGVNMFPGGAGSSWEDRRYVAMPIAFGRDGSVGAPIGFKGVSAFMKWKGAGLDWPVVYNIATDAYAVVRDVLIPWPENIEPML